MSQSLQFTSLQDFRSFSFAFEAKLPIGDEKRFYFVKSKRSLTTLSSFDDFFSDIIHQDKQDGQILERSKQIRIL